MKHVTQEEGVPSGWMGLDIGLASSAAFLGPISRYVGRARHGTRCCQY